jgi:uncharacterized protein
MKPKFEIRRTSNGKYMFNLRAANDQVILTSQMYGSRESAEVAIGSVKENAGLEERFEQKIGAGGKPHFVLRDIHRQIIATSEVYTSREGMLHGIASVKRNAPLAETVDHSAHMTA